MKIFGINHKQNWDLKTRQGGFRVFGFDFSEWRFLKEAIIIV